MLEHHGHPRAQPLELAWVTGLQAASGDGHQVQRFAGHADLAAVGAFEQVQAAQEGAFAGAAGADHGDHVTRAGLHADAFEHFVAAVAFGDAVGLQWDGRGHGVLQFEIRG